ncbi:hypothetical protein RhiirC2_773984 [Rhizophagus irregularis]|uniref:Uncharacterized protein n=1 Tax=Rhizophagus irregularis TaxID=588596 RepID=A0A2N1NMS0_9GLOM|nr:hypothetical protein RhiirC2_773984 [Rhizophagus irregularis]
MGIMVIKQCNSSYIHEQKYKILEQEYYKLFINNYKLLEIAQICQDIENLSFDGDNPGLIKFIDNQKNLQSLCLSSYSKSSEMKCIQLSETIEKKADTLIRFTLFDVLLSPKFLPSLINLEQLKLRIYSSDQNMQELKKYLLIASFPKLQYLDTQNLSPHGVLIAKNCPNIESLHFNTYLKNLGGVKEIILNCNKLRKLGIDIIYEDDGDDHEHEIICDEVLNYLLNYSPRNFDEFTFNRNWRFSVNNLKKFFEDWRGRKQIKFIPCFNECVHFTQKHIEILHKYYNEGVIDIDASLSYGMHDY